MRCCDPTVSKEERLKAIGIMFFATGQAPAGWTEGWHLDVEKAQMAARERTPTQVWWVGGSAPILVLQATEDQIAVPANAERLAKQFPDRVRVIEIPGAGHAMLPEQPDLIASAILKNIQ